MLSGAVDTALIQVDGAVRHTPSTAAGTDYTFGAEGGFRLDHSVTSGLRV